MRFYNLLFIVTLCFVVGVARAAVPKKVVGGDISMLTKYYDAGKKYYDADGSLLSDAPAFLSYLKAQGLNSMRVRLFVDPSKASSAHKGQGVCQDLDYVKKLGKQIKDAGLCFLLDFHYSDTWTDPGQHSTPASWNSTDPTTLGNYIYNYTVEALTVLKNYGAEPDDIQIGNEVTNGELWPTGHCYANEQGITEGNITGSMANFVLYLKRSAEACRQVCPNARIVVHTELSNNGWGAKTLYPTLKKYDVDYDIIGLSYYPHYHGTISNLESVITSLEQTNGDKKIQIVEVGAYYLWGPGTTTEYEVSETGQKQFTDALVTMLNNHSSVNGLYWWWLESNEYGTSSNVTTDWYAAGLWHVQTGKPCSALFSLKNFITDAQNVQMSVSAYFINEPGWSTVKAYAGSWGDDFSKVFTADWPGTTIGSDGTMTVGSSSYSTYQWTCDVGSIRDIPQRIQFNNGGWESGNQSDLVGFLNGGYYRYYQSGGSYVSECYKVDIADGAGKTDHSSDFWCLWDVTPKHVSYQRVFTASQPVTICLPFALTAQEVSAAGSFYVLDSWDGHDISFVPVTATEAYTPYLFVPSSSGMLFADLGEKEIKYTELVPVVKGDVGMYGVMERTDVASGDDVSVYGYLEDDGQFVKVKSAHVNPFRAYITLPQSASANVSTLGVVLTGSEGIAQPSSVCPSSQAAGYSLMGTRVGKGYKGIVVRNGKKVIVK